MGKLYLSQQSRIIISKIDFHMTGYRLSIDFSKKIFYRNVFIINIKKSRPIRKRIIFITCYGLFQAAFYMIRKGAVTSPNFGACYLSCSRLNIKAMLCFRQFLKKWFQRFQRYSVSLYFCF